MGVNPFTPPHTGRLHVQGYLSFLVVDRALSGESRYLLVLRDSAAGRTDSEAAGAATAYLMQDLGKREGSPLTVWGLVTRVSQSVAIAMERAE